MKSLNRKTEKNRKVAIVHDALCVAGGAERVVLWMSEAYPEAPIYTSVYLPDQTFPEFKGKEIYTLPFSNLIKNEKQFKLLFPLWLMEFQKWDFANYDTVLSSSTYLAKYIHPTKGVRHKAYIYAPFRFLWKPESYTSDSIPTNRWTTTILRKLLPVFRNWDIQATRKIPDVATSCQNMSREIKRIYNKPSVVIYPPISIKDYPLSSAQGEYFLTVSRLISHKKIDLAIEACNRLKKKLIVVGDGPEMDRLTRLAGDTVKFTGRVSDQKIKQLYQNSLALIFPSHEDYGLVPLEAQACGKPVIAFGQGGVLETIKEGETGLFFSEQTVDSLEKAINNFRVDDFSPQIIREWANRFNVEKFISDLRQFIGRKILDEDTIS